MRRSTQHGVRLFWPVAPVKASGAFERLLGYVEDEGLAVRLQPESLPGHGKELPANPQDAAARQGGIRNVACGRIDHQVLNLPQAFPLRVHHGTTNKGTGLRHGWRFWHSLRRHRL